MDSRFMTLALRLARKGYGSTSPNPMVGAVLIKGGQVIGRGWHHRAGEPHAEIEAIRNAQARRGQVRGSTLYVTLEPCCTHGRTPPCTEAILAAGIKEVVVAAIDPNPAHSGKGIRLLREAGVKVTEGMLAQEAARLNEAFNHWIVQHMPFVTVKAAMTLDGKIATAIGESKWITGETARAEAMRMRQGTDAILVGVNTVIADDPSLTARNAKGSKPKNPAKLRRIILDSRARTPLGARVIRDEFAALTTIVVTPRAPSKRVAALAKHVSVWTAPEQEKRIDLRWILKKLGQENVTSLLVEGGGEVNASFLLGGLAQRIAFFYAPKIMGGRDAIKAVAGAGLTRPEDWLRLDEVQWRRLGEDWFLTARVK